MLMLFFGLFYSIGFALLIYALYAYTRSNAVAGWPTTQGAVISATLKSSSDSDGGTTYSVEVAYSYTVASTHYTGNRLAFGYSGSSGQSAHQEILDRLNSAKSIDVHYNPRDPATSALSFGMHRSLQFMFVFSVVWVVFTGGMHLMFALFQKPDTVLLQNLVTR